MNNWPSGFNISNIDENGLIKIKFSEEIKLVPLEAINSESMEILIIPNPEMTILSKLDFTFNCTNLTSKSMEIQLFFEFPNYISYLGLDQIKIKVLNPFIFKIKGTEQLSDNKCLGYTLLSPTFYSQIKSIPRQMENISIGKALNTIGTSLKNNTQFAF